MTLLYIAVRCQATFASTCRAQHRPTRCLPHPHSSRQCNYGGVAAIISNWLSAHVSKLPVKVTTFESVCFSIHGPGSTADILLVYHPGSMPVTSQFYTRFSVQLPKLILSAEDFLDFFNKNVEAVREATGQGPTGTFLPPDTSTLNSFQLFTADIADTSAPSVVWT